MHNLLLKPGTIKKAIKGLQIDFSAIAKGGGVDLIANYLSDLNINRYMIEIGGEITVSGKNWNNKKWKLGIRKPVQYNIDIIKELEITNISLATSGTYENYLFCLLNHAQSTVGLNISLSSILQLPKGIGSSFLDL